MTSMAEREAEESGRVASNGATHAESVKPITIMLPDDMLKKLKVIAIVRETSVSELVSEAAAGVVKRELKRALSKISGE
ncbi:MAG: ribbon-helix-helix protein, CopG family [Pseudomonadota bacterium]